MKAMIGPAMEAYSECRTCSGGPGFQASHCSCMSRARLESWPVSSVTTVTAMT
jgi:hypothetical protein